MKPILFFNQISIADIGKVGGKNASLGEMYSQLSTKGVNIPNGFALTADAYRLFCNQNNLTQQLNDLIKTVDTNQYTNLVAVGNQTRQLILESVFPAQLQTALVQAYHQLSEQCGTQQLTVAVRSSATAEDLPTASFAGRMESYLNICGEQQLLEAVKLCRHCHIGGRTTNGAQRQGIVGRSFYHRPRQRFSKCYCY